MRVLRHLDLAIGVALVGALLFVALYGEWLAPHDAYFVQPLLNGQAPPFEPQAGLPLGTDDVGHDLWSWVLLGARTTFLIAVGGALIRLVVGGTLGMIAGWQGGTKERVLSRVALSFSSFPSTILAVLGVIAFNVYSGALGFALALGLLGWAEVFSWTRRQTRAHVGRPYIETARSVGMSEERVVVRHLVPNLAPGLVALFALQVSAVLLLLGEIGLLRIFIGGGVSEISPNGATVQLSSQPDWSGMLAGTRPIDAVTGAALWQILAPAGALLFSVAGINLLGDAIARRAQSVNILELVSRRSAAIALTAVVIMVVPLVTRPHPLAAELAYAGATADPALMQAITAHLVRAVHGRQPGSEGAAEAAAYVAEVTWGTIMPVAGRLLTPSITLVLGHGQLLAGPDLDLVAEDDANVSGRAVAISGSTFGLQRRAADLAGSVVFALVGAENLDTLTANLHGVGAQGLVLLTDAAVPSPHGPGLYPIPVVRASPEAVLRLIGRPLPSADDVANGRVVDLDLVASVSVTVGYTNVSGRDVIARRAGTDPEPRPIVIVAGGYEDVGPPHYLADSDHFSASTAGLLAAIARGTARAPLAADLIVVFTAADQPSQLGLVTALGSLSESERDRVSAIVVVSGALGPFLLQPDIGDPTRVGRKVADALGLRARDQGARGLVLMARGAGLTAPSFLLLGAGDPTGPSESTTVQALRSLLTLIAYIASHPAELRP